VDDDAGVSNNLGNYFPWDENGFHVVEKFYDGYSAYDYLQRHHVDLIFSDIKMPGMNGIELAKKLSDQNRKEIVVFISAYKDFEYARKALEYGVYYYFLKPFTYHEIKEKLQNIKTMLQERSETNMTGESGCEGIAEKQILRIKQYIDENIKTADLASIADYIKMNHSYLSRFFKEKTGENFSKYITRARMHCALLLLRDEQFKNIYEISEAVGYSNPVSFSKVFSKQFRLTPAEYRRSFKKNDL
jgi:YesN/AraC family two-component response regulator